jgi:hypothetical protein
MPAIIVRQASNPLAVDFTAKIINRPKIDGTDATKVESKSKVVAGGFTYEGKI